MNEIAVFNQAAPVFNVEFSVEFSVNHQVKPCFYFRFVAFVNGFNQQVAKGTFFERLSIFPLGSGPHGLAGNLH